MDPGKVQTGTHYLWSVLLFTTTTSRPTSPATLLLATYSVLVPVPVSFPCTNAPQYSVTLSCTSTLSYTTPSAIALRTSTPIITFSLGSVSLYVPLSFSVLSSRCASMRYGYAMLYCAELLISLPGADRPKPASSSPFRPTPKSRIPWHRAYRKVPSRWKFGEPFMVRYVT